MWLFYEKHFAATKMAFWGQQCSFDQKKAPAAARRYNNKGFKQKKGAYGSTQVQKQRF